MPDQSQLNPFPVFADRCKQLTVDFPRSEVPLSLRTQVEQLVRDIGTLVSCNGLADSEMEDFLFDSTRGLQTVVNLQQFPPGLAGWIRDLHAATNPDAQNHTQARLDILYRKQRLQILAQAASGADQPAVRQARLGPLAAASSRDTQHLVASSSSVSQPQSSVDQNQITVASLHYQQLLELSELATSQFEIPPLSQHLATGENHARSSNAGIEGTGSQLMTPSGNRASQLRTLAEMRQERRYSPYPPGHISGRQKR